MSGDPFQIPLDMVLFPEPVAAGMDLAVIGLHTAPMRKGNEDPEPVVVAPEGKYWRIVDGRHRAVAAMAAGRKLILAVRDDA